MRKEVKWWGWGLQTERYPPEALQRLLDYLEARGMDVGQPQGVPRLPSVAASRLRTEDVEALREATELTLDDQERLSHSLGKGYLDLQRFRVGLPAEVTDGVAMPKSVVQVKRLLEVASSRHIAVVPYGGGTSVLGGLRPLKGNHRAVITVDLRRLNRVLEIDETSMLARVEAGILGPELEETLQARGLTLGHYPQSFHFSTVGGWIATRSSGHLSGRYGRIEDMVHAVKVVTPAGEIATKEVPARSVGPELKEIILGSEGSLGIILEAVLRVRGRAEAAEERGFLLEEFSGALMAFRRLVQSGIKPAFVRLSDEEETQAIMAIAGLEMNDSACLAVIGFEGAREGVSMQIRRASDLWSEAGGLDLGGEVVSAWREEYYKAPYLRDDLLDRGFLVETFESAASWSRILDVYRGVSQAVQGVWEEQGLKGLILCHLSHAYTDGGSLYFTVLAPRLPGREMEQWTDLKSAATEAILTEGGTLSHHHGIGTDHIRWMKEEHGEASIKALKALKAALDPSGIMNPEKLLEEEG
ncbi:MAG: FAD-binding oxidoreductase [Thermoplasmata archaeon]